jgi:hypothetical protein
MSAFLIAHSPPPATSRTGFADALQFTEPEDPSGSVALPFDQLLPDANRRDALHLRSRHPGPLLQSVRLSRKSSAVVDQATLLPPAVIVDVTGVTSVKIA